MPIIHYPPYCEQRLRELLNHLAEVCGGDPAGILPSLTEPALYAFTAGLALLDRDHKCWTPDLTVALLAELRWRNCRTMGSDPTGQVRLARLIQMVSAFTTLSGTGVSSLLPRKLIGDCPLCESSQFQVFLPVVRWRCFNCDRRGGLLEFAEQLLQIRGPQTPSLPAARAETT